MRCAAAVLALSLVVPGAGAADPELERLAGWMSGSFSSAAQAAEDPDFRHIVLHMARIWPQREDGIWLYVEQAAAESAASPYRQRVYHLRRVGENLFGSSVFTFADPLSRAGAWHSESPLADLPPEDLEARQGCTIYLLERPDGAFEGSTLGRLCRSDLRGATWASSEVVIDAEGMVSWDRGFDDAGAQVWGAEKAGYRFERVGAGEQAADPR